MARSGRLGRFASLAPACCLMLHGFSASAQASAADKAAAEALFDQGVRLMKQDSFAEACTKLEESDRIDPAVGTLLYLAECYERTGKTASAWATFREAASLATNSNQADRARVASARAQALEPKLSRLSIDLAPEVAALPGVVVKRGAQRLEPSLYGTQLPVDPGEYKIEVTAPGYEPWRAPIKVEPSGASASVRVPALVKSSEAPSGSPAQPATTAPRDVGGGAPAETQPLRTSEGLSTQQTLGLVVGAVGIVGVGVGSYFGVRALKTNSDAETHCPKNGLCNDQEGVNLTEDAKDLAVFSNIAFAAGGLLLGTGAVLYLTGGSSGSADRMALVPILGPRSAGANVVGRF